jgi:metal-responsive CopG/Arc/MetJ family transcriptional regulator
VAVDTTQQSVVMPTELATRLEKIAKRNERKRAAEIRIAIREYVERHEAAEERSAA